jgi:outer membrane protein
MSRLSLWLICLFFPLLADAQINYGYFSYDQVLRSMPEYEMVEKNLADLRSQYDGELKRAENDFNKKYEEFLEGQKEYAPIILQKRQSELQDLMMRNIAFKAEAQRLLAQATEDALRPLRDKLNETVKRIGEEQGYSFVFNTDGNTLPYINPAMGTDITEMIKEALQ